MHVVKKQKRKNIIKQPFDNIYNARGKLSLNDIMQTYIIIYVCVYALTRIQISLYKIYFNDIMLEIWSPFCWKTYAYTTFSKYLFPFLLEKFAS